MDMFDNVIIKVCEWDGQAYSLDIVPTLRGIPVKRVVFFQAFLWGRDGIIGHERHQFDDATDTSDVFSTLDASQQLVHYWVYYHPNKIHKWTVSGTFPDRVRLVIALPNGSVIQSEEMVWADSPMPL